MSIQKILAALILTGLTISLVIFGLKLNKKSEESSFLGQKDMCIKSEDYCSWYAQLPHLENTPCCHGSTCDNTSLYPYCKPDRK